MNVDFGYLRETNGSVGERANPISDISVIAAKMENREISKEGYKVKGMKHAHRNKERKYCGVYNRGLCSVPVGIDSIIPQKEQM